MYFSEKDILRLSKATSFQQLAELTIQHIQDQNVEHYSLVIGPVTTGGLGDPVANILLFDAASAYLREKHQKEIFPSAQFEPLFDRLIKEFQITGYPYELVNEFFAGLITSSLIETIYLLPDRESSTGAKIEYEIAKQAGVELDEDTLAGYTFLPEHVRYQLRKYRT